MCIGNYFIGAKLNSGLLVAYLLKHWTVDQNAPGSDLLAREILFFWVHSALPKKLSRRFSFASFRGNIKLSVSASQGTP